MSEFTLAHLREVQKACESAQVKPRKVRSMAEARRMTARFPKDHPLYHKWEVGDEFYVLYGRLR